MLVLPLLDVKEPQASRVTWGSRVVEHGWLACADGWEEIARP
jgi:hypothetical protein